MKRFKFETWMGEQAALFALLVWAFVAQLAELRERGPAELRTVAVLVASSAVMFFSQKLRSMGDRQQEKDQLAGVQRAFMSCGPKVRIYAVLVQGLGLVVSVCTAPRLPNIAIALYIFAYPYWRRFYRSRVPARPDLETLMQDAPAVVPDRVISVRRVQR